MQCSGNVHIVHPCIVLCMLYYFILSAAATVSRQPDMAAEAGLAGYKDYNYIQYTIQAQTMITLPSPALSLSSTIFPRLLILQPAL